MLILASQSPRRRELLSRLGLSFSVLAADIDETMDSSLPPESEVARLSREKALAIHAAPQDIVIAADTIVVCDGVRLGKPHSKEEAAKMLRLLSGRDHQVVTGYTVLTGGQPITKTETSHVFFRPLSEIEIAAYIESGEPMDKAGAYGIQGLGAIFVRRLEGDYYNVMGLPLCALYETLKSLGVTILGA